MKDFSLTQPAHPTIAIIGVGNIGGALLAGMLDHGFTSNQIIAVARTSESSQRIQSEYGVYTAVGTEDLPKSIEMVILAVKPKDIVQQGESALASITRGDDVQGENTPVMVSLAAGISLSTMQSQWSAAGYNEVPIVRVMPNTPMLIGQGMSGIAINEYVTPEQEQSIVEIMGSVGEVLSIPEEKMGALIAVSGSAPAYLFLVAEAMEAAAVDLGFDSADASMLTEQTLAGAAELLRRENLSAEQQRVRVTSPGGTTHAAISSFEEQGFKDVFAKAMGAAVVRSEEMDRENS